MSSLMVKSMAWVIGLALVAAASVPADAAKARKHRKIASAQTAVRMQTGYRGTRLFPAGPIYNANDYLGDDPDPFIRSQIQRDLGAHYGGEN
jgi:hypothetical protein